MSSLTDVNATVRYLDERHRGTSELPRIGDKQSRHENTVEREIMIRDARKSEREWNLDSNGFMLVGHTTEVKDFSDPDQIDVYRGECCDLVKQLTGAAFAVVTEHLVRTENPTGFNDGYARFVHLDYSDKLGSLAPQILRNRKNGVGHLITKEQAVNKYEYAFYNVWQPFDRPVNQNPLALLDKQSLAERDLQEYIFTARGLEGLATMVCPNKEHRWWYFPQMQVDECLVFKQYDARDKSGCRQCPHISFWDNRAAPDVLGRRSIEVRLCCAFKKNTASSSKL